MKILKHGTGLLFLLASLTATADELLVAYVDTNTVCKARIGIADHRGCYDKGVIFLNERYGSGYHHGAVDLDSIHFPHFANTDPVAWRLAGYEVAEQMGLDLGDKFNVAALLGHEAAHAAGYSH